MTNGIEKLVNEVVCLRLEVERLRAELAALQDRVADSTGEVLALRLMLTEWPVVMPDDQPPVQH